MTQLDLPLPPAEEGLNGMEVTHTNTMGDDISIVNAARVSFDKESFWEEETNPHHGGKTFNLLLSERDNKLLKYLAKHNHWSPFTHSFLSFRVKAPIFVARQLAKHQIGLAWNEVSRRYVSFEPEFYTPKYWRKSAESVKQGSSDEIFNGDTPDYEYENFIADCTHRYSRWIEAGMCPEQARMALPQSMMTEWIWSGSLYAFVNMCKLRLDTHTQRETREIAKAIAKVVEREFPYSYRALMESYD